MDITGTKMACLDNSGSASCIFLKILLNESGQEVLEHCINSFSEKKCVQGKWTNLGPKILHPYNSGSILRFF